MPSNVCAVLLLAAIGSSAPSSTIELEITETRSQKGCLEQTYLPPDLAALRATVCDAALPADKVIEKLSGELALAPADAHSAATVLLSILRKRDHPRAPEVPIPQVERELRALFEALSRHPDHSTLVELLAIYDQRIKKDRLPDVFCAGLLEQPDPPALMVEMTMAGAIWPMTQCGAQAYEMYPGHLAFLQRLALNHGHPKAYQAAVYEEAWSWIQQAEEVPETTQDFFLRRRVQTLLDVGLVADVTAFLNDLPDVWQTRLQGPPTSVEVVDIDGVAFRQSQPEELRPRVALAYAMVGDPEQARSWRNAFAEDIGEVVTNRHFKPGQMLDLVNAVLKLRSTEGPVASFESLAEWMTVLHSEYAAEIRSGVWPLAVALVARRSGQEQMARWAEIRHLSVLNLFRSGALRRTSLDVPQWDELPPPVQERAAWIDRAAIDSVGTSTSPLNPVPDVQLADRLRRSGAPIPANDCIDLLAANENSSQFFTIWSCNHRGGVRWYQRRADEWHKVFRTDWIA